MGLLDVIRSLFGAKPQEPVEGPSGGPHPGPPEETSDDREL